MTRYFSILVFPFLFISTSIFAQSLITKQIYFDSDQDSISSLEQDAVSAMISKLEARTSSYRVHLIGHTDNQGSLSYNQDLSRRRAETIQDLLITFGFVADQVSIDYKAYLSPVDEADNEVARAKNRRVDVIIEPYLGAVSNDFHLLDNTTGGEFSYTRSKTKITIPPDAFIYPDGTAVEGEVLISYREFRDFADFMMTDLPMNFNWEGEDAYFNSTGMFEIKAYDLQNKLLALKPNKNANIAFDQQQVLEGTAFWNFDEEKGEWFSGNPFIKYKDGEVIKVKTGTRLERIGKLDLRFPSRYLGKGMDTIARLQAAHALLRTVLDSVSNYRNAYVPQLDVNRFRHRTEGRHVAGNYAGTQYIGHLSFAEVYENPDYYNIELKAIDTTNSKKVTFTITNLSSKNPELAELEGVVWKFNQENFAKLNKIDVFEKRFAHIRIRKRKKGKYNIKLKYKDEFVNFEVTPVDVPREEEEEYSFEDRYLRYAKQCRTQRRAFDKALEKQLEESLFLWPCVQLLLPNYIPEDKAMIAAIKPALKKWGDDDMDYWVTLFPPNSRERGLESIPGYSFLCNGARFFKPQLLGDNLHDTIWYKKIQEFNPAVNGEIPIYTETYQLFENPIPVLVLDGLGVFNLDVLKRFNEEKKLLARFETVNGDELRILKVEVINHRLNGLLRFDSPEIYMDLGSPNTIVVHTVDGKIYYLNPDDIDTEQLQDKSYHTFFVKELDDFKERPEAIRDLLAGI